MSETKTDLDAESSRSVRIGAVETKSTGRPMVESPAIPASRGLAERATPPVWAPRGLCLACHRFLQLDTGIDHAWCRCVNNTVVSADGVSAKVPRNAMSVDADGVASRIVDTSVPPSVTVVKKYTNLFTQPVRFYNRDDQQIAEIPATPGAAFRIESSGELGEWEFASAWPIPIIREDSKHLVAKATVDNKDIDFNAPIIAPEYVALLLTRAGYRNALAPDTSPVSTVLNKKGEVIGYRRLARPGG